MAFRSVPVPAPRSSHFAAPLISESSVPSSDAAVAAAATAAPHLVRLDEFNENNVEHWFNSHTWQFLNNKVTKASDKYSLARAKLPRSITDAYTSELDALFQQDDPYEALRHFLIEQFGKSKWISYFELLSLPVVAEDIRPSAVYQKLKSLLPFGADPNNEIFMAMFLLRLPPSIREQVGSAGHTTVAAMVSHADRVWSFRGGPDQTVAAAAEHRSRSPASAPGRRGDKKSKRSKSRSADPVSFQNFRNPPNGSCKFHNYYGVRANKCVPPCNQSEN